MGNYNYQLNMMNTGWRGLLQPGYSSYGMPRAMWGGNNFFTNCTDEPNYNAIAGAGVANALTCILGLAISSFRAQKAEAKQAEVDTEARLKEVNAEIEKLEATDYNKAIDSKYDRNIDDANTKLDNASNAFESAKELKKKYKAELDQETDNSKKATIQKAIDALKVEEKQAEFEKLDGSADTEGSVKYYEKQKAEAIKAKQEEINKKIEELKKEKAELEKQVTNTKLAKAQGKKYQATSQKDFDPKWDNDGNPKADVEFKSGDMRFAIGQFSKAVDPKDKKDWANKINTIYRYFLNNDTKSITSEFKFAAQTAQKYLG